MKKLSNFQKWYYLGVLDLFLNGKEVVDWKRFKSKVRPLNAYYSKRYAAVIKKPKYIMDKRTPLEVRVPTFKLKDGYVLQPLLEKKNLGLAVKKIEAKLKPHLKNGILPDLHVQNVGWLDNKPFMFDW